MQSHIPARKKNDTFRHLSTSLSKHIIAEVITSIAFQVLSNIFLHMILCKRCKVFHMNLTGICSHLCSGFWGVSEVGLYSSFKIKFSNLPVVYLPRGIFHSSSVERCQHGLPCLQAILQSYANSFFWSI